MAKAPQDAIALQKADHRNVEELFEKAEKARDGERKQALVRTICIELMVHSTVEEEIFYPACKGAIEEEDVLDEAYVEHDGAKVLISELLHGSPEDEFYDAKVKVLSELKHHVKEEEARSARLFAQAREAGVDTEALGTRLFERKAELLADFQHRSKLPPPQTRSFTGHVLVRGQPLEPAGAR